MVVIASSVSGGVMSQYVWVSSIFQDAVLQRHLDMDVWQGDQSNPFPNYNGEPISPDDLPNKIWAHMEEPPIKKLPPVFDATSVVLVSSRVKTVLEGFDLGDGGVFPLQKGIFQSDQETLFSGDYFSWVIGNKKEAFLPGETPEKEEFGVSGSRWTLPITNSDDNFAVSKLALEGPDQWVDPFVFKGLFLSARLGDALIDLGLKSAFFLNRCRVI